MLQRAEERCYQPKSFWQYRRLSRALRVFPVLVLCPFPPLGHVATQASRPVSSSPSVIDGDPVVDPHHTGGKPCDPLGLLALGP